MNNNCLTVSLLAQAILVCGLKLARNKIEQVTDLIFDVETTCEKYVCLSFNVGLNSNKLKLIFEMTLILTTMFHAVMIFITHDNFMIYS